MGKTLIIKGADFSASALEVIDPSVVLNPVWESTGFVYTVDNKRYANANEILKAYHLYAGDVAHIVISGTSTVTSIKYGRRYIFTTDVISALPSNNLFTNVVGIKQVASGVAIPETDYEFTASDDCTLVVCCATSSQTITVSVMQQ